MKNQRGLSQAFIIVLVALLTAGIVGGGVWYWQQQQVDETNKESLERQDELNKQLQVVNKEEAKTENVTEIKKDSTAEKQSSSNASAQKTNSLPNEIKSINLSGNCSVLPEMTCIEVVFNESMDASTINENTLVIKRKNPDGEFGSDLIEYSPSLWIANISISHSLFKTGDYVLEISNNIKDASGNQISNSYSWDFKTNY